jgi:hypothetical protein
MTSDKDGSASRSGIESNNKKELYVCASVSVLVMITVSIVSLLGPENIERMSRATWERVREGW